MALFALAKSLGFGATQANVGHFELFGLPIGKTTEVILILSINLVALISVLRGLDGGVKVLFKMLDQLPLASITSFVGIILVIVFFVTSSDPGSPVIDTITAGGKVDAPMPQGLFWCVLEGAGAIALLIGGALAALQSMVISTGPLFTVVLLLMCYCNFRRLQNERAGKK